MTRKNEEFAINGGPSKLYLMLSLFDTDMGARTVRFQVGDIYTTMPGRKTNWLEVQIISARRRNTAATIWEIEGITDAQGGKTRVSIYYLSDTREGRMRFEEELLTHGIMETPDDAKRARGLMIIIEKMVAIARNHGGLPEEFYRLFEKAKRIKFAEDSDSLTEAINNI